MKNLNELKANAKHSLLMKPEWNSLKSVAEQREVYIRKDRKIALDIVDVQGLIGDAIDDFFEIFVALYKRRK